MDKEQCLGLTAMHINTNLLQNMLSYCHSRRTSWAETEAHSAVKALAENALPPALL